MGMTKRRNQLDFAKSTFFKRTQPINQNLWGKFIISFSYMYMIKYVFIQKCTKFQKISTFGVDFDQYFYVSIDFVQIEIIGQNDPPNLFFL